jgi:hypothetical protein
MDPEYAYLFNSLHLARGYHDIRFDHPGTPLFELGAAVIKSSSSSRDRNLLAADILSRPEQILGKISVLLAGLTIAGFAGLGLLAWRITGSVRAALLIQLTPFFSNSCIQAMVRMSPETLLLLENTAQIAVSLLLYDSRIREPSRLRDSSVLAIFSGLLTGLGLATKVTWLPVAITSFISFRGAAPRAFLAVGTVVSFVVATRAVWPFYPQMTKWFLSVATHSEAFGSGERSIFDPAIAVRNVRLMTQNDPVFFALFLGAVPTVLSLAATRVNDDDGQTRALAASCVGCLVAILMTAKHAGSPHYLLPVIGFAGHTTWQILEAFENGLGRSCEARVTGGLVLVTLLLLAGRRRFHEMNRENKRLSAMRAEAEAIDDQIASVKKDAALVVYFGCSLPEYALYFGNMLSNLRYGKQLAAGHPRCYFYNVWEKRFEDWQGPIQIEEIQFRHGRVLMRGIPFAREYAQLCPELVLVDLHHGVNETLYEVASP